MEKCAMNSNTNNSTNSSSSNSNKNNSSNTKFKTTNHEQNNHNNKANKREVCTCPHLQELLPDIIPPISPALLGGTVYQHHILSYYKKAVLAQENAIPSHLRSQDVESYFTVPEMVAIVKEDWLENGIHSSKNEGSVSGADLEEEHVSNMYVGEDGKAWAVSEGMSGSIGEFYDVLPIQVVDKTRELYGDRLIRPPNSFKESNSVSSDKDDGKNRNGVNNCVSLSDNLSNTVNNSETSPKKRESLEQVTSDNNSNRIPQTVSSSPTLLKTKDEAEEVSRVQNDENNNEDAHGDRAQLEIERFHQLESLEAKLKIQSHAGNQPFTAIAKRTSMNGKNVSMKGASQGGKKRKTNVGARKKGQTISAWCTDQFKDWLKKLDPTPVEIMEDFLERIRQNRIRFWTNKLYERKNVENSSLQLCCIECNVTTSMWESKSTRHPISYYENPDDLMQCLTCGIILCTSSNSINSPETHHIMEHFILSGHGLGITCGLRGDLFCMICGDFVYSSIVDRTIAYTEVAVRLPWFRGSDKVLERSITTAEQILYESGKSFWPGLVATYPDSSCSILREASLQSLRRIQIFRGENEELSLSSGDFDHILTTPVGIHNLGNTCYMSSILQVLIFTPILQEFFIKNVGHDYLSCKIIRRVASDDCSCLACELDEIFVKVISNSRGIDLESKLKALKEKDDLFAENIVARSMVGHHGAPISPSNILSALWNETSMKCIAGYAQRDAHEFLLSFMDVIGKHIATMYVKSKELGSVSPKLTRCSLHSDKLSNEDTMKTIFEGSLRSVLLCEKCGCKRLHKEPFLILSLPLQSSGNSDTNDTISKTHLYSCLDSFCQTEQLHSLVFCTSCNDKTSTRKQLAFERFPKVLCIHLKRFDAISNKKISDPVEFPAELNMGSYISQWREVSSNEDIDDKSRVDVLNPSVTYDLYGTINHKGSLYQGHYTANVKAHATNHWYHCNDEFVYHAGNGNGEKEVLNSDEPYMLFYARRKVV